MSIIALDLFAGTGVGVACKRLGIEELGVEIMPEAVATRKTNGMRTIFRDVWDGLLNPMMLDFIPAYTLLWGSPPCQTFSMAGNGAGRRALDEVIEAIRLEAYKDPQKLIEFGERHDMRTALVLTPLAYAWRDRPEIVVLEQVPTVLPVWEACAEVMREWGYSVAVEVLHAEQYGIVAACPIHENAEIAPPEFLQLERLATADPVGTELGEWLASVQNARRRATFVSSRGSVESARTGVGITPTLTEALESAWNAALLAQAVLDSAKDAIWKELVSSHLSQALGALRILPGRAAGSWMKEGMSRFEWEASIAESTASLLKNIWVDLCRLAKLYTTSTGQPTTMSLKTSRYFAATHTITPTTERDDGPGKTTRFARDLCGVCDDHATPQTRKRAILVARLHGEARMPTPTHSRYYSTNPTKLDPGVEKWVSMAEALGVSGFTAEKVMGKGMVERHGSRPGRGAEAPAFTIRASAGGMEPGGFVLRSNYGTGGDSAKRGERTIDQPSATITSKADRMKWDGVRRLSLGEAAALQSYPSEFVWSGKAILQIGNAVPPLLAQRILEAAIA